jgi:hypothetical protein
MAITIDGNGTVSGLTATGLTTAQNVAFAQLVGTASPIGAGQTWQNLLASRAVNTVYTNSSGKPIQVSIVVNESRVGEYSRARLQVDSINVAVASSFYSVNGNGNTVTAIVPNGSTYQLIPDEAAFDVLIYWAELR